MEYPRIPREVLGKPGKPQDNCRITFSSNTKIRREKIESRQESIEKYIYQGSNIASIFKYKNSGTLFFDLSVSKEINFQSYLTYLKTHIIILCSQTNKSNQKNCCNKIKNIRENIIPIIP